MLKLLRYRVACIPIFDSSSTGIEGFKGAVADKGYTKPKDGNIVLLDDYRERVDQGIVKYIGAGVTRKRFGFGIGDMVIFSGYSGELVSIEGEGLFIILPARFVVCSIDPKPTVVSGLYFREASIEEQPKGMNRDDYLIARSAGDFDKFSYFPATYEKAMELIAKSLEETSTIKIAKDRPTLEDYAKVEEDDD